MRIELLDHGYVELIESWGADERVIEAARQSTDGNFVSWEPYEGHPRGDAGLLSHLYTNKHTSPFEFAGMTIAIQAPIMVFREWHRHRTQSYSEISARYTPLPNANYVPILSNVIERAAAGAANKQAGLAKGATPVSAVAAESWLRGLDRLYGMIEEHYQLGLEIGIPKELARLPVPVGRYSRMWASTDLLNWLKFLTLRMAPNAQWEIRQYANAVGELIAERFPRTWELFAKS